VDTHASSLVGVLLFLFFQNLIFLRNPVFLRPLFAESFCYSERVFANASRHFDFHQHTVPVYDLWYQCRLQDARTEFSSNLTENTWFEFDQSEAVTCKFSVGDVSNSWQHCRCSHLTGKNLVFKFDQSGNDTSKLSVGDVRNSWQHCRWSRQTV
jgi:hypothetical protein